MKLTLVATAAAAAVLIAATPIPAAALDLGGTVKKVTKTVSRTVSGLSGGSSSAGSSSASSGSGGSTSSGGTTSGSGLGVKVPLLSGNNLSVDLLNESGVASVGVENETTGSRTGVSVLSGFQLSSLGLDPETSAGPTSANGRITLAFVRSLYQDLDRLEQQQLVTRCGSVLRSPKAFDRKLVKLCQIVGGL